MKNVTVKSYRFGLFSLVTLAASSAHASWNEIDLNPVSSAGSRVNAVFGNMQGGFAELSRIGNGSAGIWTGSASSWVDLAPAGATSSSVVAISGATEAGVGVYDGYLNASVWSGTAASWQPLPSLTLNSDAKAIGSSGPATYVGGFDGENAVLWTQTATPGPAAAIPFALDAFIRQRRSSRERA